LDVDGNALTHLGLIAIKSLALSTPSLVFVKWLQHDLRSLKGSLHPRALKVALDIYGVLARRRDMGESPWPLNPLEFDQRWPIPTGKPAPLATISDQLQALSTKTRAEVSFSRELDLEDISLLTPAGGEKERRGSQRVRTKSHNKRDSALPNSDPSSGTSPVREKRSIKIVSSEDIAKDGSDMRSSRGSGSLDVPLTMIAPASGEGSNKDEGSPGLHTRVKSGTATVTTTAKVVDGKWSVGEGDVKSPPRAAVSGHRANRDDAKDSKEREERDKVAREEAAALTERARSALKKFTTTTVKLTKLPLSEAGNSEVDETVITLRSSLASLWDEASALDAVDASGDDGVHARQTAMVADVQSLWPLAVDVLSVISQIRSGSADASAYAKALTPIVALVKGLKVTLEALSWDTVSGMLGERSSRLVQRPGL